MTILDIYKERGVNFVKKLITSGIDGVIIGCPVDDEIKKYIEELVDNGFPVVIANKFEDISNINIAFFHINSIISVLVFFAVLTGYITGI